MSKGLAKFGLSVLFTALMLIPLWIFLAANAFLDPVSFMEKAAMIALGWVFLGAAQIWALMIGIAAIIAVWSD